MAEANRPIIIKRIKKSGGGHHGGAWKVAYADFVTAMMAFFLLLWLLNATTEDQQQGIADYFSDPFAVSTSNSGAGGVFGGQSMRTDGQAVGDAPPILIETPIEQRAVAVETPTEPEQLDEDFLRTEAERLEKERFERATEAIRDQLDRSPELRELRENLIIDQTSEGLRIQIVDRAGYPMFPAGSATMLGASRRLHAQIAEVIADLPNMISIRGHTDAVPYRGDGRYTNWELSADRANASRQALLAAGLPAERIANVVGKAATDPIFVDDPANPGNRRISIILLTDMTAPSAR